MHGGQFSSSNIKYSRKVENKLPSTWRTNDDIDAS
jgi:hypothetical protein